MKRIIFLLLTLMIPGLWMAKGKKIAVIPQPVSLDLKEGTFKLSSETRCIFLQNLSMILRPISQKN